MIRRRRGVFLVEMLTVALLLTVGGTLMAVGLASIMRSHLRVAQFDNRYARINDFLATLSRDVRRADFARVEATTEKGLRQVLAIGAAPRQVSYRVFEDRVERTGFAADAGASTAWEPMIAIVTVADGPGSESSVVNVTVLWPRGDDNDTEPNRRLDAAFWCAGEVDHARD